MSKALQYLRGLGLLALVLVCCIFWAVVVDQAVFLSIPPTATATTQPTCQIHGLQWDDLTLRVMWSEPDETVHTYGYDVTNWDKDPVVLEDVASGSYQDRVGQGSQFVEVAGHNYLQVTQITTGVGATIHYIRVCNP